MTELEINQTLHKAMGFCLHEWYLTSISPHPFCKNCTRSWDAIWADPNGRCYTPEYTSDWQDYGKFLEWAMTQEWFDDFLNSGYGLYDPGDSSVGIGETRDISVWYINPLRGSTAFAKFLKGRK